MIQANGTRKQNTNSLGTETREDNDWLCCTAQDSEKAELEMREYTGRPKVAVARLV